MAGQHTENLFRRFKGEAVSIKTVSGGLYEGRVTEITNDSPLGGRETDWLVTVLRPDGQLHYFIGVAPQREFTRYSSTFDKMVTSLRFYNN